MNSPRRLWIACLFLAALAGSTPLAHAELKLPTVISDHMVLQRDRPLAIWGWDTPGTEVSVKLGDATAKGKADADGKWSVQLSPQKAGGPHTITIAGTNSIMLQDVLVGEVWLCSGQSNMEWAVDQSKDAAKEIEAANHPRIRHIKIPHTPMATPQTDVMSSGWLEANSKNVPKFTAVGYYFARNLQQELDVPIGLIGSNWGGTRIEPWTPPQGFRDVPALKDIADKLDQFPAKAANGAINHQSPLALYNGMIAPLVPYTLRGAIWYQGESNNGEGMLYHEKMKALIGGWRTLWGQPDMPFGFVQLAPYRYGGEPTKLPEIWEAQAATLAVPHTGMAAIVDIGNVTNIHPTNKQDVGKRLALWALAKTYGREGLVFSGPMYKSKQIDGNKIRITFDHIGTGLVSRDGQPLSWFTIAGADGKYIEAKAEIDGKTVVVQSESIASPVSVRFAWNQEAEPNLSNKEGLPASPFRTDK